MAFHDTLGSFGELSLASLDDPAVSAVLSDSIDTTTVPFGAEPIYLVVTVTESLVAAAGSPAYCFALEAATATATDPATVLQGYDVWRFGNVDFGAYALGINTTGKGVLGSTMTAGTTLFTVPIGMSPQLTASLRYLTLTVQQVVAGASTTSGKVRAYLTSTPPNGNVVYPDAI